MAKGHFDWSEITTKEARAFSDGEFKGMTVQAFQDIRDDIKKLQQQNEIRGYISFGIAGLAGLVGGAVYQITAALSGKH